MITYSQMHRTNNYSQHSSIKLSGCGFESRCCHIFRHINNIILHLNKSFNKSAAVLSHLSTTIYQTNDHCSCSFQTFFPLEGKVTYHTTISLAHKHLSHQVISPMPVISITLVIEYHYTLTVVHILQLR